jgi:uncharacterized DUF497 family protein
MAFGSMPNGVGSTRNHVGSTAEGVGRAIFCMAVAAQQGHSYTIAMRIAEDPEAERWLRGLGEREGCFDWDDGNRNKNRKHGVESWEVESIFDSLFVFAGRIVEPAHPESRFLLLGKNGAGRALALIFTRRGERIRPISCRSMRKKERRLYEDAVRGE